MFPILLTFVGVLGVDIPFPLPKSISMHGYCIIVVIFYGNFFMNKPTTHLPFLWDHKMVSITAMVKRLQK